MSKNLKKFEQHSQYEEFKNSSQYFKPNVSWCKGNKEVHYEQHPNAVRIKFEDPEVEKILLQNFDTNNKGYLTLSDCAKVTSLGRLFYGNTTITKFNEFKYFIGLQPSLYNTDIIDLSYTFRDCTSLEELTFPKQSSGVPYGWHASYNDRSPLHGCLSLTKVDLNGAYFKNGQCAAFYRQCRSLQYSQDLIPEGFTFLENYMFMESGFSGIVDIPEGILHANYESTTHGISATGIVMPTTLESINPKNWNRDGSWCNLYLKSDKVVELLNTDWSYHRIGSVYVPQNLLENYLADEKWAYISQYLNIKGDDNLPESLQPYKKSAAS